MAKSINVTIPNLSSLNLEIKLDGDWVTLDKLSNNLTKSVLDGYNKAIEIYSQKLLRIVKRALTSGTPPPLSGVTWPKLSQSTIDRYGSHNIYNLTGAYARSVGLHKYKSRTLIGLPINQVKRSTSGGITLNQLALILEYGNKDNEGKGYIPPRPLWAPSLESAGGKKKLKAEILKQIRSSLYKGTGIRPNQVK